MSKQDSEFGTFVMGFFFGALLGGTIGLLFAPQSGEETRDQIRQRSIELTEQASQKAEEARMKAEALLDDARKKFDEATHELQEKAQEMQAQLEAMGKEEAEPEVEVETAVEIPTEGAPAEA